MPAGDFISCIERLAEKSGIGDIPRQERGKEKKGMERFAEKSGVGDIPWKERGKEKKGRGQIHAHACCSGDGCFSRASLVTCAPSSERFGPEKIPEGRGETAEERRILQ
ncbi:hypothetical protein NDU88_011377 [Pleurodeles waltl]|uniref:Uncharacterized protein n=1 Tax=Pleurodeles waltl TaxID=8319 RepID=A0AAV7Q4J8_PLEWA|nr:hypothetical protein NDU88_011377 [Pleurodeles waltl]